MAAFDQPYFFRVIQAFTQVDELKIKYVGHSQGTTQMFAALSANYITSDDISHFAALAPVVNIHLTTSGGLYYYAKTLGRILSTPNVITSANLTWTGFSKNHPKLFSKVASWGQWLFAGYSKAEEDPEVLTILSDYFSSQTSGRDLDHWNQLVSQAKFTPFKVSGRKFYVCDEDDSLDCENLPRWDTLDFSDVTSESDPPRYPLERIQDLHPDLQIYMLYGKIDALATPAGVKKLKADLGGVFPVRYYETYDHSAFIWGDNVEADVNAVVSDFFAYSAYRDVLPGLHNYFPSLEEDIETKLESDLEFFLE